MRFVIAKTIILLFLQVVSLPSLADSTHQHHQDIEVGISMSIPPWVIKENNSGIELDIINASFEGMPYKVSPLYLPFERAYKLFDVGQLDVVINAKAGVAKHGYLSDTVVTFQNYAISLKKKGFNKHISFDFLRDKSIVAFQKAKDFLGPQFKNAVEYNRKYQEVAEQDLQINLLFIRELDFIVMDKSIFGYFWHQALKQNKFNKTAKRRFKQEVVFHPLFEAGHYPFIFKDKKVRDDFNAGLAKIRANGTYQSILKKYDHLADLYQSLD